MRLDPDLWTSLEHHGVTTAHLEMLLRLLQMQRNGSWAWRYVNGKLAGCEITMMIPARGTEVARVCELFTEGDVFLQ